MSTFASNKVAREILENFDLNQVVVLTFSEAKGYEILSAGANQEDAQIAAEVAKGLSEGLTPVGLPVKLVM